MRTILGTTLILITNAMALAHPGHPARIEGGHIHPAETLPGPIGLAIVSALAITGLLVVSARMKRR